MGIVLRLEIEVDLDTGTRRNRVQSADVPNRELD